MPPSVGLAASFIRWALRIRWAEGVSLLLTAISRLGMRGTRTGMNAWLGLARLCLMLLVGLSSVACAQARPAPVASRYASDVAVDWFDLSLDLVRETHGFSPPVASRSLGYLGVGLYETVQPGMPGYRSLAGQLNGLARLPQAESMAVYHWPTAANTALASLTRKFFARSEERRVGKERG